MNEKETKKLNEGRLLRVATPVLLPILKSRRESAMGRLTAAFKSGESNYTALVAELVVLQDLENEVLRKNKELEHIEEKAYGN